MVEGRGIAAFFGGRGGAGPRHSRDNLMQQSDGDGAGDGVDREAVRRLYEADELPLGEIREKFAITQHQLMAARLAGGWQTRPQIAKPGANQGNGVVYPRSLLRRIVHIVDERLKADEAAVARGEPPLLPASELMLLTEVTLVAKKGMYAARRGSAPAALRRGRQKTKAVGGGFATAEEARAADVAFMRAELKRRMDVLAAALRRGEELPAGFMRGRGEAEGGP
jgi:hypothetical protein